MDYAAILKQYWGYDSFRGIQLDIIESIGAGRDTLGLMPTGGGKSVTFQVPALAMDGICVVITPLIALMKDQVQNLKAKGIKALAVHSGMTRREIDTTLDNCIFGRYHFLYVSPERLESAAFRDRLCRMRVCMIAVDESHCISQWGYDFRPSYLKIAQVRDLLPGVPVLALTATATPKVVEDIQRQLRFSRPNVFSMSFERKNLAYVVRKTEDKRGELLHILRRTGGSAIVYVRNRRRTKEIADWLNQEGIAATHYHAGLDDVDKDLKQRSWKEDGTRVMVATNAFGMGIDKPDVRVVAHLDLPDSIEAYFQEAGRAGRDGKRAYAVLLHGSQDRALLKKRVADTFPDKAYVADVYEKLQYYYQMAMGDGMGCTKVFDLDDFCRAFKLFPTTVDSALRILTLSGYILYDDERNNASRLMFTLTKEELYRLRDMGEPMEQLIQTILRSYTGLFSDHAYIDEALLSLRTGLDGDQVYQMLKRLSKLRIVSYIPRSSTPYITYTRERVEQERLLITPASYEDRKGKLEQRIEAMLAYADNEEACRSRLLLRYFGEKNDHDCRLCDNCRKHARQQAAAPTEEQVGQCLKPGALTPAEMAGRLGCNRDRLLEVVERMLAGDRLVMELGKISLPA